MVRERVIVVSLVFLADHHSKDRRRRSRYATAKRRTPTDPSRMAGVSLGRESESQSARYIAHAIDAFRRHAQQHEAVNILGIAGEWHQVGTVSKQKRTCRGRSTRGSDASVEKNRHPTTAEIHRDHGHALNVPGRGRGEETLARELQCPRLAQVLLKTSVPVRTRPPIA